MKWEVWNTHKDGVTFKDKFRDEPIEIPAGKFVLMDYEDAVLFKGQYFQPRYDAMGQQIPSSMKMIDIRPHGKSSAPLVDKKYVCHMDGKEFDSAAALAKYIKENYADSVTVDESAEAEIKQKTGKKASKE